jgi:hypothetical protein
MRRTTSVPPALAQGRARDHLVEQALGEHRALAAAGQDEGPARAAPGWSAAGARKLRLTAPGSASAP